MIFSRKRFSMNLRTHIFVFYLLTAQYVTQSLDFAVQLIVQQLLSMPLTCNSFLCTCNEVSFGSGAIQNNGSHYEVRHYVYAFHWSHKIRYIVRTILWLERITDFIEKYTRTYGLDCSIEALYCFVYLPRLTAELNRVITVRLKRHLRYYVTERSIRLQTA